MAFRVPSSLNPWRGLRGLPVHVWIVSGTMLIQRMGTMVLPFLSLYLTRERALTPSEAGLVLAAYGAGGLVSAPLGGWLSDRIGAVRVMVGAFAGSGLLLVLFPLVVRYEALVALTAVWAMVSEAARPATLVALTDGLAPAQRKPAIALNRLALNLGFGIGPTLGGLLASLSFTVLFAINAATALGAGAFLAIATKRTARPPSDAGELALEPRVSRFGALGDPRMAGLFVGTFLTFLVFEQHRSTLPLYVTGTLGLSAAFYGALFVINTGLILLFEVGLNLATGRWPHARTLALGAALVALGFGATGLAHGPLAVALAVVVWTFGEMLLLPGLAAYVTDVAPAGRRGAYMGAYSLVTWMALIPAPYLGTLLLERQGPGTLWAAAFAVGAAAALAFAVLGRRAEPVPTT